MSQGKVVGFYDSWPAGRRFAVDMAGFAVNIKLLHQFPNATIIYKAGFEEDSFLQALVTDADSIEAKAANCTQVETIYRSVCCRDRLMLTTVDCVT